MVPARLWCRQKSRRVALKGPCQVLSRLKVGQISDLHIHLYVLRQPTHNNSAF
jgi:hypothetical protein